MEPVSRCFQAPKGHFFLFGPRGSGKSTWLRRHFSDALTIDLLDPENQRVYAARPERLAEVIAGSPHITDLVIDEVQKAPALLDVIHRSIESKSGPRFILTGSSSRKLKRTGVNLLAGRALLRSMHPFTAAELGSSFDLDRALSDGLLPLVLASDAGRDVLKSYVSLYVREEVMTEGLVRNVETFARFLEDITLSHGQVLSYSQIARECQVSGKTVRSYVEILEDLLIAFRVPVFARRAKRHLTAHPKFYWFDTGVYDVMRRRGPLDSVSEIGGAALEGLVAQHLRAWNDYSGSDHSLHFWRTKSEVEVDFVVYGPLGLWALEVKHGRSVQRADLRGLRAFREDYPEAQLRFLYRGVDRLEIDGIPCVPVDHYLRAVRPGEPLP
ncbi:MAG: ATP-binding protein [Planctomycetota bacterium]